MRFAKALDEGSVVHFIGLAGKTIAEVMKSKDGTLWIWAINNGHAGASNSKEAACKRVMEY